MTKPDIAQIFNYDSATEEHCQKVVDEYRLAAKEAIREAGKLVLFVGELGGELDIEWRFIPEERSLNK